MRQLAPETAPASPRPLPSSMPVVQPKQDAVSLCQ